jgi:hypothetical protein
MACPQRASGRYHGGNDQSNDEGCQMVSTHEAANENGGSLLKSRTRQAMCEGSGQLSRLV